MQCSVFLSQNQLHQANANLLKKDPAKKSASDKLNKRSGQEIAQRDCCKLCAGNHYCSKTKYNRCK